jgi:HSP20 family molecular chaperone IbpA
MSASLASPIGTPLVRGAVGDKEESAGFVDKMKQWQDKMSNTFRDAWEGWRGRKEEESVGAASMILREQRDKYILRLNLPNRDLNNVEIKLEGNSLHIAAPAEKKVAGYEQTINLSNIVADSKLQIDRRQKDNMIVVTVPKSPGLAEVRPPLRLPNPSAIPHGKTDRDIFARMENITQEIDRIVDESLKDLRLTPETEGFFDQPRFGSSLDLQEEGDHYVIRAYLPDRSMDNVNVMVEGQALKIEAKAEDKETQSDNGVVKSHKAHFAQVVTLPSAVQAEKMKVDKQESMLVVTLPKA